MGSLLDTTSRDAAATAAASSAATAAVHSALDPAPAGATLPEGWEVQHDDRGVISYCHPESKTVQCASSFLKSSPISCTKPRSFCRYEYPVTAISALPLVESINWKCLVKGNAFNIFPLPFLTPSVTVGVAYRNTPYLDDMCSDLSSIPKVMRHPPPQP